MGQKKPLIVSFRQWLGQYMSKIAPRGKFSIFPPYQYKQTEHPLYLIFFPFHPQLLPPKEKMGRPTPRKGRGTEGGGGYGAKERQWPH